MYLCEYAKMLECTPCVEMFCSLLGTIAPPLTFSAHLKSQQWALGTGVDTRSRPQIRGDRGENTLSDQAPPAYSANSYGSAVGSTNGV